MDKEVAERLLESFKEELNEPERYLDPSEALRAGCLAGVECLFGCLKRSCGGSLPTGPLERLYTEHFDEEQVWEEVQLANEPALRRLHHVVGRMVDRGIVRLVSSDGYGEDSASEGSEGDEGEKQEEDADESYGNSPSCHH